MNFRVWLESKYFNFEGATCGHCMTSMFPTGRIPHNPKHVWSHGQEFQCNCGKSKVWTNSIRNVQNLKSFFQGKCDRYYNGFCNDLFCGFCFEYIRPLENGVTIPSRYQRLDRYGCEKCAQNQNILVDGSRFDREGDTSRIMAFYQRNKDTLDKIED